MERLKQTNDGGTNGQVTTIRVMDPQPAKGNNIPAYPNGYVKYENGAQPTPQAVNPYTGKTGSKPDTHFPLNIGK